jgi:hypothetical protein
VIFLERDRQRVQSLYASPMRCAGAPVSDVATTGPLSPSDGDARPAARIAEPAERVQRVPSLCAPLQ